MNLLAIALLQSFSLGAPLAPAPAPAIAGSLRPAAVVAVVVAPAPDARTQLVTTDAMASALDEYPSAWPRVFETRATGKYYGARYYGSKIGRFTTVDPVYTWEENILDPQRWSRYAYARNNPLRYVDPDGRVIRVADAGALALIQSTLPANLRSAVSLTKEGTIDAKALSSLESSDANFRDLTALASHSGTVDVSTSAKATYKDASGNTKSDSFFYDSGADLAKYGLPVLFQWELQARECRLI
jgi:RHS repeat-associated protein